MQTFLPYPNFQRSAAVLDNKRLGKQRVECLQILNAIHGVKKGWTKHPATLMWENYVPALAEYCKCICLEWISRGFSDSILPQIEKYLVPNPEMPYWFGDDRFHAAHRSNLLRKDYDYYSQFKWTETSTLPYYWPKFKDYRMPGFIKTNRNFNPQEKWTMAVKINICKPGVAPLNAEAKIGCQFLSMEQCTQFTLENLETSRGLIFVYSPTGEEFVWRN